MGAEESKPQPQWRAVGPGRPSRFDPQRALGGSGQVTIHVYDLDASAELSVLNGVLRTFGTGIFHCGIEVYNKEWSFRGSHRDGTGVFSCTPRRCAGLRPRESVPLGMTSFASDEVSRIIRRLEEHWPCQGYNMLRCNCGHFCDEFARCLGVSPVPEWAKNLAGTGASLMQIGGVASSVVSGIASMLAGSD
ncbi:unnamed protein product, partial [Polarella glacialis]